LVGIGEVPARAHEALISALSAEVERILQRSRGLLDRIRGTHRLSSHHVVIYPHEEVLRGRLTIDETPRLERRFLRVALALDYDPVVIRPLRRFGFRIVVQNVGKEALQQLVRLALGLDLAQEALGDRPGVGENPEGWLSSLPLW